MNPITPLLLDFETQAMVPISNPLYTSHPETKALMMSYGFLGGEIPGLWWAGDKLPQFIVDHVEAPRREQPESAFETFEFVRKAVRENQVEALVPFGL